MSSDILGKSSHGNISTRIPGTDTFLLTSVSNLKLITMDNIGLFDLDNNLLDGAVIPTSAEIIPMHGIMYKTGPEAGGAVHTHAPRATAFAVAGVPIPPSYEPMVGFWYGQRRSRDNVRPQRVAGVGGFD